MGQQLGETASAPPPAVLMELTAAMRRLALALALTLSAIVLVAAPAEGRAIAPPPKSDGQVSFPPKANARIIISQDEQQMLIYDGEHLVRTIAVSTGWPGLRKTSTPVWSGRVGRRWGTFSSYGHTQDDGYWLFTDYLDDGTWNGDILIHGAPYDPGPAGQKDYDRDGIGATPLSNGCIRIQPEDAAWFSRWDPVGVPITITPFSRGTLAYPKIAVGAQLVAQTQSAAPQVAGQQRP